MFKGKFVNLVDLVDTGNTGLCVSQFDTLKELKPGECLSFCFVKF